MPIRLSRMVRAVAPSDIRTMSRACAEAGGINLGQGICDLPTHPLVQEGAIEAIRAGRATYSPYEGIPELREAVARKMASYNRLTCDPAGEVVVTAGSTGAFAMAVFALCEPGDEVVVFEPFYGYHVNTLAAAGLAPIYVPLRGERFEFDPRELARAFTPRTRAIVVCTPSNPCGKVFTREELAAIARLAVERDIVALTDEIYEYILFDGAEHVSLATLPGMRERTVTISGLSKTFSITGWRLGYAVAPVEIAHAITVLSDLFYICAPTPLQYGGARGLSVGPEYYADLARSYAVKRSLMAEALRGAGMAPILPQGAYYMLADVHALGWNESRQAARLLLEETGVASVPGAAFYHDGGGDRLLRFCFAKEDEALVEAGRRMAARTRRAG